MRVIERIYEFVESKGITINEFSKIITVSNGYFSKQRAGKANVGSQILEKIVKQYPEINSRWLLTGEGKMLRETKRPGLIYQMDQAESGYVAEGDSPDRFENEQEIFQELLDAKNQIISLTKIEKSELEDIKRRLDALEEQFQSVISGTVPDQDYEVTVYGDQK